MVQNSPYLLCRNAGEPLHKLRNLCAIFKVLKKCRNRYARSAEHPRSADTFRIPLNRGAC